jgi:hypothetical protein
MATKIAEDLTEDDRIMFEVGVEETHRLTVQSRHVHAPGGVDQVSAFCYDEDSEEDRIIGMAFGQELEVPGW